VNAQMIAATIQLILAPVVMVSACAILVTGLLSRYAAINDRLRAIGQERLDLLRRKIRASEDPFIDERLAEIDYQIPDLLHRHKLAQNAVLAVYSVRDCRCRRDSSGLGGDPRPNCIFSGHCRAAHRDSFYGERSTKFASCRAL
jgi:Protein of unknown function (DUF2721)